MPFPKKSTLLVSKDEWVSFNGDGYSVRLFNIDETSGWINLKNCEAKGFVITFFKDLKEQPLAAPEYIDLNEQICAKFQNSMGVYELLIIQRDYVFFYWSVS